MNEPEGTKSASWVVIALMVLGLSPGSLAMPRVSTSHTLLVISIQTVAFFAMDLMAPLGIVVWVLYLIPLGLTAWLPQRYAPILAASLFSGLLVFGAFWDGHEHTALINRTIGLGLLWTMGILLYKYKHQLTARLDAEVEKRHSLERQLRASEASLEAEKRARHKVRRQYDRYLLQRSRDFESACRISEVLLQQTSEDALLQETLESAVSLVNAEAGSILTLDRNRRQLTFRAVVGPGTEAVRGLTVPSTSGIAGAVLAVGMPEVISATREDRRHDSSLDLCTEFRTQSLIAVPLQLSGEEALGVLELLNKRTGTFTPQELQAVKSLVMLLTATLGQLRIYYEQPQQPSGLADGTSNTTLAG